MPIPSAPPIMAHAVYSPTAAEVSNPVVATPVPSAPPPTITPDNHQNHAQATATDVASRDYVLPLEDNLDFNELLAELATTDRFQRLHFSIESSQLVIHNPYGTVTDEILSGVLAFIEAHQQQKIAEQHAALSQQYGGEPQQDLTQEMLTALLYGTRSYQLYHPSSSIEHGWFGRRKAALLKSTLENDSLAPRQRLDRAMTQISCFIALQNRFNSTSLVSELLRFLKTANLVNSRGLVHRQWEEVEALHKSIPRP